MVRPHKCRFIAAQPGVVGFKPRGIPARLLEGVELRLDELEALRLADLEGLYHEAAAERMGVSRPTFGRLIEDARRKVADALVNSKMLVFNGGHVVMENMRTFECAGCGHRFEVPHGTGRPGECPSCHGSNFHRAVSERGQGRGACRRRGGQGEAAEASGGGRCRRAGWKKPARENALPTTGENATAKGNSA